MTECANCGYDTETKAIPKGPVALGEQVELCEVCRCTFLGRATTSMSQVSDPALYRSIGYIANMILCAVKEAGRCGC